MSLAGRQEADGGGAGGRRLMLMARGDDRQAELEFVAASGDENLEDVMILLSKHYPDSPVEHELSLRLLRHYASSVRHQQYHGTDILTIRVDLS